LEIKIFTSLPEEAKRIRTEVFVVEQGFKEEFDSDDKMAIHLVCFDGNDAIATSRIIKNPDESYIIGRIAVSKEFRKGGIGAKIIKASEEYISNAGGKTIYIHSQLQAMGFYAKQGYSPIGEQDDEEGCPHQMMIKKI